MQVMGGVKQVLVFGGLAAFVAVAGVVSGAMVEDQPPPERRDPPVFERFPQWREEVIVAPSPSNPGMVRSQN
jgi:hypothetical protein